MTQNARLVYSALFLLLALYAPALAADPPPGPFLKGDLKPAAAPESAFPGLVQHFDSFPVVVVGTAGEVVRTFDAATQNSEGVQRKLRWVVRTLTVEYVLKGDVSTEIEFRYGFDPMDTSGSHSGFLIEARDIEAGDRLLLFLNDPGKTDPSFMVPNWDDVAVTLLGPPPGTHTARALPKILAAEVLSAFNTRDPRIVISAVNSFDIFSRYQSGPISGPGLQPRESYDKNILAALKNLSRSSDPALAIPALSVLVRLSDPDAPLAILEGIKSGKFSFEKLPVTSTRPMLNLGIKIYMALESIHDKNLAPMLIELLNNPRFDATYARGLMTALANTQDARAIPSFLRFLDSEDRYLKAHAVRSLESLAKETDLAPATRPPDLAPEDSENDDRLSEAAAAWLTWWKTAGQKALEELVPDQD